MSINPNSIAEAIEAADRGHGLPPVQQWDPPSCGSIDIRISVNGTWYHEGCEIRKPRLIRLFSTILRKENDSFFLVTPNEKLEIVVEDAPFLAIDLDIEGTGLDQNLTFTTSLGDRATAGLDNPLRVVMLSPNQAPSPYVLIRDALEAKIDRKCFYRMVEAGQQKIISGEQWFGVASGGHFFPLVETRALNS